jgi:hypothetical protein
MVEDDVVTCDTHSCTDEQRAHESQQLYDSYQKLKIGFILKIEKIEFLAKFTMQNTESDEIKSGDFHAVYGASTEICTPQSDFRICMFVEKSNKSF